MLMWVYFPPHKSVQKCNVLSTSCLEETGIAIATRLSVHLEEQQLSVVVMQCIVCHLLLGLTKRGRERKFAF